jgi:hypothetical protein
MQTDITKNTHTAKTTKHLISNEVIGSLINLSGRQRMLSQRIILNTLLASQGQLAALEIADQALHLFEDTHTILVQGNSQYPGIFFEELQQAYYGESKTDNYIKSFINIAQQTITTCKNNTTKNHAAELTRLITALGEMSNEIVIRLNEVTLAYEHESQRRSALRSKQQLELMSSIQKIAKEARIVSFNAQVIAARAGESGREFAVVASVLTDITQKMDDLTLAAMANT